MVAVVDFKKICLEERKSDKPEFKPYEIFGYFAHKAEMFPRGSLPRL